LISLPQDPDETAMAEFDRAWDGLSSDDKARVLRQLIERVEYDGAEEAISVVFRPNGSETTEDQAKVEFA
jgi:hypothetical protein